MCTVFFSVYFKRQTLQNIFTVRVLELSDSKVNGKAAYVFIYFVDTKNNESFFLVDVIKENNKNILILEKVKEFIT